VSPRPLSPRVLLACLGGWFVVWLGSAWVTDDAYITFRTVDLTLDGFGPRWNIAERVQAYSHPLWFVLLLALAWLGLDLFWASVALGLVCSMAAVRVLLAWAPGPLIGGSLVTLLVASKSFVEFSSSGMENALCHLIVLGVLAIGLGRGPIDPLRRGIALGSLVSALALCRLDLMLIVAPLVGLVLWRGRREATPRGWLLGLLPLALWELVSLIYYGDVLPNTACAKLNHVIPLGLRLEQGLDFYGMSLSYDYVTVPIAVLGGVAGLWSRGPRAAAGLGLLAYLVYVWWIPGDFMAGRFHSTPLVLGVAILVTLAERRPALFAALAAVALVGSLVNPRSHLRSDQLISREIVNGVADERAYYYALSRVEVSGSAHDDSYSVWIRRSGGQLKPKPYLGGRPIVDARWGGMFAYEEGASLHIVDEMGLSDPLLARLPAVSTLQNPQRPGHLQRPMPAGYLKTLRLDRGYIEDPAIAALWADVELVTRGPIWDPARLAAIRKTVWCGAAHRGAAGTP
jgi:arabinofuranosyltransferase